MSKTNITIIDVNLGEIDNIISSNIAELQGDAKKLLEHAIHTKKEIEKVRQEKIDSINAASAVIETIYNELINNEKGIKTTTILEKINPHITTVSAFALRMRKFLELTGKYSLGKKKINNEQYYILELNENQ